MVTFVTVSSSNPWQMQVASLNGNQFGYQILYKSNGNPELKEKRFFFKQ